MSAGGRTIPMMKAMAALFGAVGPTLDPVQPEFDAGRVHLNQVALAQLTACVQKYYEHHLSIYILQAAWILRAWQAAHDDNLCHDYKEFFWERVSLLALLCVLGSCLWLHTWCSLPATPAARQRSPSSARA